MAASETPFCAGDGYRDAQGVFFLLDRAKTGRGAVATISRRTERLVSAYMAGLGVEIHDKAPIFRTRGHSGGDGKPWAPRPYTKDKLGKDFREIRTAVFGEDETRTLLDFRRSGAVEAIAGGAAIEGLAAKMANDIDTSRDLHKTYAPVEISAVREVDAARRKGRRKNETQPKVGTAPVWQLERRKPVSAKPLK